MGGIISRNDNDDLYETTSSNFDNINGHDNQPCSSSTQVAKRGKRRRFSNANFMFENEDVSSSKHFKLDITPHVFKKMFLESYYSDVTIHALGHQWHLHRVYLEQCDYFKALFNGNWLDSKKKEYKIEINDENVTYAGLNNVFASLYNNEIEIDKKHIAGVVSAASMLSLNSVLKRCSNILSTYVSIEDILLNLKLSDLYGFQENVKNAIDFLKYSFWRYSMNVSFLKELKYRWFAKILSSDILCIKENEMDLYLIIKKWIFFQNFPDTLNELNDEEMNKFFSSSAYNCLDYIEVLRNLRVTQLTLLLNTLKVVRNDCMIPKEIIDWVMRDQWNTLLINEEAKDLLDESIDDDFFYRHCFRLGRCGNSGYGKIMWRWLGCFFGTDLLINYSNGYIRFLRNCTNIPTQQRMSVKMCEKIRIHYRIVVCNEENGNVIFDTKRQNSILEVDGSLNVGNIGLFNVLRDKFSVHVFYLASIPGPSSTYYWDNFVNRHTKASS